MDKTEIYEVYLQYNTTNIFWNTKWKKGILIYIFYIYILLFKLILFWTEEKKKLISIQPPSELSEGQTNSELNKENPT